MSARAAARSPPAVQSSALVTTVVARHEAAGSETGRRRVAGDREALERAAERETRPTRRPEERARGGTPAWVRAPPPRSPAARSPIQRAAAVIDALEVDRCERRPSLAPARCRPRRAPPARRRDAGADGARAVLIAIQDPRSGAGWRR